MNIWSAKSLYRKIIKIWWERWTEQSRLTIKGVKVVVSITQFGECNFFALLITKEGQGPVSPQLEITIIRNE